MYSRFNALVFLCLAASIFIHQPIAIAYDKKERITKTGLNAPCIVGRTAPPIGFWSWPANTRISVYLRTPDFSASDVQFVQTAVENWDANATANRSNVHFIFQGLTGDTKTGQWELTIVRHKVYDKHSRHLALLEAHSRKSDQSIDYALMLVDPLVKDPGKLTNVVAHELGHSLGLLDCYACEQQSTAMGLLNAGSGSNGIDGPTICDQQGVMSAYESLANNAVAISSAE